MNLKLCNGIRSVIAAFLHQFSLYPLFMMSNIIPFIISYLYHIEKESSSDNTSSLTQNDGYFIHPIMSLCMSIFCFFGGIVEHFLGPKLAVLMGGVGLVIGDILFIVSKNLIFDFVINICFGIGFGISMTAAVKNATKYFPKKRGLINALVGAFGGNLGNSFFNLVIKYCVSKGDYPRDDDNNMYQKSTAQNYKIFLYIHGGIAMGFSIIAALLLVDFDTSENISDGPSQNLLGKNNAIEKNEEKNEESDEKEHKKDVKKENKNTEEKGEKNNIEKITKKEKNKIIKVSTYEKKVNNPHYNKGLKQIFKCFDIYLILLIFLLTAFLQGFIYTVGFNYGTMSHNNDEGIESQNKISPDNMSIIFMLSYLISGVMGPFSGFIYDKLQFRSTMIIIDALSCINGILINFTVKWGVYYYAISIILNGCLNSWAFSMIFPYVSKIFGFLYAGELYGFVVLSTGISNMISSSAYYTISHFSDNKNNNAYFFIFISGSVCNILAGVLAFFDKEKKFKFQIEENDENKITNTEAY